MSTVEQLLQGRLVDRLGPDWDAVDVRFCGDAGILLDLGPGAHVEDDVAGTGTAGTGTAGTGTAGTGQDGTGAAGPVGSELRGCLGRLGLDEKSVELFAVAAETVGALAAGDDLAQVAAPSSTLADAVAAEEMGESSVGADDLGARVAGASAVLGLVGALTGLSAHLDGALTGVVSDLCVRNGRILLARRGVDDPEELSANQAARWRGRVKGVTRREVAALTGWGEGEVTDLVGLTCAPAAVADPVISAMNDAVVPWRLARRFFREFGTDAHEDATAVATALFGTDPDEVCTDRLDPEGRVKEGPWEHKLFYRAVERERARLDSADPQSAARARDRARERRDVRGRVEDDGTGCVFVNGTATQVAAVMDRLEKGARAARAAGDGRTLAQLRADIAMSLLLHSGLDLPGPPGDGTIVSTAWTEQMAAVLAGLPRAVLQVIVPFDALVHSRTRPLFDLDRPSDAPDGAGPPARSAFFPPGGQPPPPGATAPGTPPPGTAPPGTAPPGRAAAPARGPVGSVGMVTGAFPFFLTADAIRELALAPGTTLYRLLTDAADGRCLERSIPSYAPDAAMRAQVHAADVTCRAPGCTQHAPYTQLDHVIPRGQPGGDTAETNLQDLHTGHHDPKTRKEWTAVMAPNRDVTWTSLLGRIYTTRCYDYRQHSTLLAAAIDRVHAETEQALTDGTGTREQALADAVDRAIYRALTYRGPAQRLRGPDDHLGADTDPAFLAWDTIDLTYRGADGRRRHGPHPDTAQTEQDAQTDTRHRDTDSTDSGATGHPDGTGSGSGCQDRDAGARMVAPDDDRPPF